MDEDPIPPEEALKLHRRLLSGDVTATAELAEMFLPALVQDLRRRYHRLHDPDIVDLGVEDALLSYLRRPERFDPARLSLWRYLRMSARGDILNLLSQRKGDLEALPAQLVVELDGPSTERQVEGLGRTVEEQVMIGLSSVWHTLEEHLKDPTDLEIVVLMMEGVRSTAEYARALGADGLPPEEQERLVKRNKDRLKKMLQRHLDPRVLKDG